MIILCLGDSLTAGYPGYSPSIDGISRGHGNERSQYEYWLEKKCSYYINRRKLPSTNRLPEKFLFINKGIPGELSSNLLQRVDLDLVRIKPVPSYSIIIVGTNDLGWGINVDKIYYNITKLHEISNKNGIKSIGASIPPIRAEKSNKSYNQKKMQLNDFLEGFFRENNIAHVDLYAGMGDDRGNLRKEYAQADGLHFSVEGYKKMGELIFEEAIKKILEKGTF